MMTVGISIVILLWLIARHRRQLKNPGHILRGSKIFSLEKTFKCYQPIRLIGCPDLIYRTANNQLIIVDIKNRKNPQIYKSDIIQLSVYAFILRRQNFTTVKEVLSYGLIRFEYKGRGCYRKISLLSDQAVIDYYHRYQALMRHEVAPDYNEVLCRSCQYVAECDK